MTDLLVQLSVLVPLLGGILTLCIYKETKYIKETLALITTLASLIIASLLFGKETSFIYEWARFGIDFSFRLYHFSSFILLAASGFAFLVVLYSLNFMKGKNYVGFYYVYLLLTLAFTNGAVLADNLIVMLFFWEGLLMLLFGFIAIGGKASFSTAIKAFVIVGISDLFLMLGIALTSYISGTLTMSQINLPIDTILKALAFGCLMIGAISKVGSMPFHSWIPNAATDAPLPFMAFVPAALEKLLGIYFLSRISLDLFKLQHGSSMSVLVMTIGAITILFAVMMALIQKDYKKLLSYHAISQVGYMILGIGTALPVGIVGGIFHMINHAMYKCCLFLTGGAVEKQTGTTDLRRLGGIAKNMPITFACFIVAAASISGVPPFNGFFSKELVYDGALESGMIFYIAAILGSFLTAASFLKLGHAAYLGKGTGEFSSIKEAPLTMIIPMVVIASLCILFGVYNPLPLQNLIQPILGARMGGMDFSGLPHSIFLVVVTVVVLIFAFINHKYGVRKGGSPYRASDHIHHAPVLEGIYDKAEKGSIDPYNLGMRFVNFMGSLAFKIDRFVDYIYDKFVVLIVNGFGTLFKSAHNGSYAMYLLWSIVGLIVMVFYVII